MKKLFVIAAAVAALSLINVVAIADTTLATPSAPAAPVTPIKALDVFHGKVSAVDTTAKTITIDSKKDGSKTFTVTDTTEIKLDGKVVTLADLTAGTKAAVKFDGTTALKIHAKTAVAKSAKKQDKPLAGTASVPAF